MTGAVAAQKGIGGAQRSAQHGFWGNHALECKRTFCFQSARRTGRAATKAGVSDPAVCEWEMPRSTEQSYPGDNRLISPRVHRRGGLALSMSAYRASWGCIRSQGFSCSPIKVVRELGSERRDSSVPSVVGAGYLKEAVPSTRGLGWTHLWCTSCHASGTAGQPYAERINAESI